MTEYKSFSDEPKFTIKTVAAETGLLPVTIRAWERRYQVLSPARADNRYRLYSERDIAILLWLKQRTAQGITISSAIRDWIILQKSGSPIELPSMTGHLGIKSSPSVSVADFVSQFYKVLVSHDEPTAHQIWSDFANQYPLATIWESILVPVLVHIGDDWFHRKISVTTEHFASQIIRARLLTTLQSLPPYRNKPLVLIGCAPDEQHEISSLMLTVLLKEKRWFVEYLGPDLPIEDLADYAATTHPAAIVLTAMGKESALQIRSLPVRLEKIKPRPAFIFGGRAFILHPELKAQIPGTYSGDTIADAVITIEQAIQRK